MKDLWQRQAYACRVVQDATIAQLQAQVKELEARLAAGEPVNQYREINSNGWYDGVPGKYNFVGPYEQRTVYLAPPAQPPAAQVPDERECSDWDDFSDGWNACRAAMLATQRPASQVPDGYTKEWCERMARLEGNLSITAGNHAKPLEPACTLPPDGWYCTRQPGHDGPCAALAIPPAAQVPNEGNLWSFIRKVMMQGVDIYQDHLLLNYEIYSARLDAASRERTDQLLAMLAPNPEGV